MLIGDFLKALGQLPDRDFRHVLLMGLLLTVLLLGAVSGVAIVGVQWLVPDSLDLPLIGQTSGLAGLASWAAVPVMLLASSFLMVPVASIFMGFFLERVADAVEAHHYPWLPPAPGVGFRDMLRDVAGFMLVLVLVNVLAFLLSLVAGPFGPLVFWGVNGYLLGREYFTLVAMRRLGAEGARALRRNHPVQVWVAGVLMAIPLTVPVLNLLVPLLGVATFTHMYHRLSGTARPR